MDVTFIGSGDAFGSGGRFNTCFLVAGAEDAVPDRLRREHAGGAEKRRHRSRTASTAWR
jgi:hypothetical protein